MTVVGLLHPDEMEAAFGAALRERGGSVLWASAGRSAATAERAEATGLEDVGEVRELRHPLGFQEAAEVFRRAAEEL